MSLLNVNILITAIGSLSAEACLASFNSLGILPFVCDIYPKEWLLHISSQNTKGFFQVPLASEESYITQLLHICHDNHISYIIPLTDPEIDILNTKRTLFAQQGIVLCIPPEKTVSLVRNKKKVYDALKKTDIDVIPTFLWQERNKIKTPVIAKLIIGRSSENMYNLSKAEDLTALTNFPEQYILQPIIDGKIITCDLVRDRSGNFEFSIREELLRTKNGAGLTVRMYNDQELAEQLKFLGIFFNIEGCVNFEFLKTTTKNYLMDINPRFSAGIAFSQLSGYEMVQNHFRCFYYGAIKKSSRIKEMPIIYAKRFTETQKEAK